MPIPGPSPSSAAAVVNQTGSPFWLSLNGVWVQVEGIVPSASTSTERPRSSLVSMNGNRFEQRGRLARRSWSWSMPWAAAAHIAAVRAAVESDQDVWLISEAVAAANMMPARGCFGTELPALDCGGVPLPTFAYPSSYIPARVRGGVATTLSAWADVDAGSPIAVVNFPYPLDSYPLLSVGGGQASVTFTPDQDREVIIQVGFADGPTSGLMLTEGDPAPTWVAGETMPCKVAIDDPDDVLKMLYAGTWAHDFTINLREVG